MNNKEIEQTNREVAKSSQFERQVNKGPVEDSTRIYDNIRSQFLATYQRPLEIDDLIETVEFV
jgi:hypothetical protein